MKHVTGLRYFYLSRIFEKSLFRDKNQGLLLNRLKSCKLLKDDKFLYFFNN